MSIFASAVLSNANNFSAPNVAEQRATPSERTSASDSQQMLFGWMDEDTKTAPTKPKVDSLPIRKKAGSRIPLGIEAPETHRADQDASAEDSGEIKALAFQINNLKKQHAARLARRRERANQLQHISQPMQTVLESYGISKEEIESFTHENNNR